MKTHRFYLLLVCLVMLSSLQAQTYVTTQLAYKHLYEVNKEWQYYPQACQETAINFQSEAERIQYHLEAVIAHLKENSTSTFSIEAQKNRQQLLDELKIYAARKVFPQNIYHQERRPYFIDHKGTHCAVGYLMKVSGAGDLARQIQKEHNYDYIVDITTNGVVEWAKEHGFTLAELAWIQPGYPSQIQYETFEGGTNGTVRKMVSNGVRIYILGDFSEMNNMPCLNIGIYENNQLNCLGTGVNGIVNDVVADVFNNKVYVTGDFTHNGQQYPIAIYENGIGWTYFSIPNRVGARGRLSHFVYSGQDVVIEYNGNHEIWHHNFNDNTWTHKATTSGIIHDMAPGAGGIFYVGDFTSITQHIAGAGSQTYTSYNAILYDFNAGVFVNETIKMADAFKVSDVIYTVESEGSVWYFGGKAGTGGACLTRYWNGDVDMLLQVGTQYAIVNTDDPLDNSVYDIEMDPMTGELLLATNLDYTPFVGTFGSGLLRYNVVTDWVIPDGDFDDTVYCLWWNYANNTVVAGGAFTHCGGNAVAHIGELVALSSTNPEPVVGALEMTVYPNPTSDYVTIDLDETIEDASVRITNTLGQEIWSQTYSSVNAIQFNLANREAGLYLVEVQTADLKSVVKLIKQ